jgi:hypothetical protein
VVDAALVRRTRTGRRDTGGGLRGCDAYQDHAVFDDERARRVAARQRPTSARFVA